MAAAPFAAAAAGEPLKLGVFGLDFTFWGIWADLLSPKGRFAAAANGALRMKPAYVWDKDPRKAQDFAKRWECEAVERYDGMAGKVDAVLNGDLYNVPWQHLLLRPYLEAGTPCLIQRHFSDTLAHLDEMLDLAAKHSAPVMATVPFEHFAEADTLIEKAKAIGDIQAVFATAEASDEPHFHVPYMLAKVLGYDVDWVSMATDDVRRMGYLNINYGFPKGERRRPFVASMHASRADVFSMTVIGSQGAASANMPNSANNYVRFAGQLVDMQKCIETKSQYQPPDAIRKKFLLLQAAYYSQTQRNSAPVKIGSVPADWAIPAWRANFYDGSEFKK
jgi:predicted dehydrogenase